MTKKLALGIAVFTAMLIMSIVYFQERTVFLDISYHLFFILKDNDFAIQNNRFGAFFTQLFPLLGSKMGLSLKSIAIIYSASFVVLPFLVFLLIALVIKNHKVGMAYLLFAVIMTTHTFYWIQSELPQGIAFMFVFFALLDNILQKESISPYFILATNILMFLICFTHPLIFIPFYFLLLYLYFLFPQKQKIVKSIALSYFLMFFMKISFFKAPYDTQAMGGLKNIFSLFPHYINLQSNKNLLHYFIHDYYFIPLLLIAVLIFYFNERKYSILFLIILFFTGYCFLINICYPVGADQFYLENQYLILAILAGFPFAYEVLPRIKSTNLQTLIIAIICFVSILRINNAHQLYTHRLDWNKKLLAEFEHSPNRKIILPGRFAPKDTLLMTWGSSYEFWLLSTMEDGRSRSMIIEEKNNEFDWAMPANKSFITKWGSFEYSVLNKKYFNFTDTTSYIKFK